MSGFLAVVQPGQPLEPALLAKLVERTGRRGADRSATWQQDGATIAIARHAWELAPDFAGDVLVLEQGDLVVAADASLYYRADLIRAIQAAGVEPTGNTPSHLIAAAYLAWGSDGVARLEGDFAFVLWDRRARRLLAARDFTGGRPLYFARLGEGVMVASEMTTITAHPAISRKLNLITLAEDISSVSSTMVEETVFSSVSRVPAGHRLEWHAGQAPVLRRYWEPPRFGATTSSGDGVEDVRETLRAAVQQRMAGQGVSTVWMSGGYDSPAIFGLGYQGAAQRGQTLLPVSMSYPVGDPGREDELIQRVADFAHTPVHWVPIDSVPGWTDPLSWAAERDQPAAHPYERWNQSLAQGTVATGGRIALSGNGGDQFFSVSPIFLSDLLRRGAIGAFRREARAMGITRNPRGLFHWAVQPLLPGFVRGVAAMLRRGRPLVPHLQANVPAWLRTDRALLRSRQWDYALRRPGESMASAEAGWYLTTAFGQRIVSTVTSLALRGGAEARSPMYDQRVLQLMASRPVSDRMTLGQKKVLLRRALAGVLPAEHLANRTARTGLPGTYLRRTLAATLPDWWARTGGNLALADLGLVDPAGVKDALDRFVANAKWDTGSGMEVFDVLLADAWIRTHS
jgi:asparagine synthase (glutamine-hydrolysing)